MTNKVRWAVVGTSDFALDWLARGIKLGRNSALAAVVSRDPVRAATAAQRVGAPHSFTSIEAIDTNLVDGVFLSVPNTEHESMTIAAAKRGLHVICEKPMAPTVEECQRMIDAARHNHVLLAVAHCMEWTSAVVKTRALLAEESIGTVLHADIRMSGNSPPTPGGAWRQDDPLAVGGGPLYDLGVHALDTITRLLGPVNRVSALIERRLYSYTAEDTSTLLLRFNSGAHGIMQSHFTCPQNSFEIQGTKGRIWSNEWLGREVAGDLHLQQGDQITNFPLAVTNVYVPQIEHISDCVLSGQPTIISGERGMANIAIIRAAIASARSGQAVIL